MGTPRPFYLNLNCRVNAIMSLLRYRSRVTSRVSSGSAEAYSAVYDHIYARKLRAGDVPEPTPTRA